MSFIVGELAAPVTADTKGFMTAIANVKRKGASAADQIKKKFNEIGDSMISTGKTLTTRLTAPLAALGAISVKNFDKQIQAENRLRAALKAGGEEVKNNMADFKAFASHLQSITTVGDESTLQMIQVAKSMGLTNEQAKRAAKNSIALAKSMGMNEQSAIRYSAALEQGQVTMLSRYLPGLRSIDDMSKRTAKAQELLGQMFTSATAEAQSGIGPLKQIKNTLGDFSEEIGKIILEDMKPFIGLLRSSVDWLKSLDDSTKQIIVVVGGLATAIGPALLALGGIVKLLPLLITGFETLAPVFAALTGPIGLVIAGVAALATAAAYVYDNWDAFKQNFLKLWANIKNGVLEFMADMIDSVANFLSYIPGVSAGMQGISASIRGMKSEVPKVTAEFKGFGESMSDTMSDIMGLFSSGEDKVKELGDEGEKAGKKIAYGMHIAKVSTKDYIKSISSINAGTVLPKMDLSSMKATITKQTAGLSDATKIALAGSVQAYDDAQQQLINRAQQFGQIMQQVVSNSIESVSKGIGQIAAGASSIGDVAVGLIDMLSEMMIKIGSLWVTFGTGWAAAMNPATLFASGGTSAIIAGGALIAAGAAIKAIFSNMGKRAEGGSVMGGSPYLVGEKGPELFMPSNSGSIIPNHKMGSNGLSTAQLKQAFGMGGKIENHLYIDGREVAISLENIKYKRNR